MVRPERALYAWRSNPGCGGEGRMADGPVVLAILDHVRRDADGRLAVPVGLADGDACSLGFSAAAARLLILELARALTSIPPSGIPAVTDRMKQAGAEILAGAAAMP